MLRRKHQRHTTIRVKVPSAAHGNRLFDEYLEIHSFLQRDLVEVAERVIRKGSEPDGDLRAWLRGIG